MAIDSKDDNVFRFVHLRGLSPRRNGEPRKNGEPSVEAPSEERLSAEELSEEPEGTTREGSEEDNERFLPDLRTEAVDESKAESSKADDSAGGSSYDIRPSSRRASDPQLSPATLLTAAVAAKRELESLRPGKEIVLPNEDGTAPLGSSLLAVTESGAARLSEATISLLGSLQPDGIVGTPVTTLIGTLNNIISSAHLRDMQTKPILPLTREVPRIKSVGVAELLVVKQQITRYEPNEIAHIENVLAGEAKARTHRKLDRIEEETVSFNEEAVTQERELEATGRFELNKEATTTTQKDRERGFGLSLSGKYGPTVEFSSELKGHSGT